jgi:hypothetical protein
LKPVLLITVDLIRTKLTTILENFSKRTLRLKIVQQIKRSMPEERQAGGDFELDSDNLSVSNASSNFSSRKGSSKGSSSNFSQTSKLSRKNKNPKMKRKRAVKEGSPFEEEYLLDTIKEETICSEEDKMQVKNLMRILILFGLV